ncbi:MAG: hypothetical protein IEMM0006_0953 [bacterium]|nr:MAG: hypothetical protein IEMM0006_0953 [bacterium]
MKKIILPVLGLLVLLFTFAGCSKDNIKKQSETDHQLILNYVTSHNLKGQFTGSGLYYVILKSGNANHPTLSSTLNTDYKGYFLNGKIFDQGTGVPFPLSRVIKGWQEGLQLIGEGGKIKLIVPSALAYGNTQSGSIPPNSVLVFDITLNSFSK